jgi:hypothetical protein
MPKIRREEVQKWNLIIFTRDGERFSYYSCRKFLQQMKVLRPYLLMQKFCIPDCLSEQACRVGINSSMKKTEYISSSPLNIIDNIDLSGVEHKLQNSK